MPIVETKERLVIMGIAASTTNEAECKGDGEIPKLWQRFFQEQVSEKTPAKVDQALYGLYTDYEADVNGRYTMLIGHAVDQHAEMPEGFVKKEVPAAKYLVFTSQEGPITEVVPKLWQQIWNYFEQSDEKRTYTGDFERYDERCMNPEKAVVEVYVAIA